jgi:hypothetical protein
VTPSEMDRLRAELLTLTRADRVRLDVKRDERRFTVTLLVRIDLHWESHQFELAVAADVARAGDWAAVRESALACVRSWLVGYLVDDMGLSPEQARAEVEGRREWVGGSRITPDRSIAEAVRRLQEGMEARPPWMKLKSNWRP